MHVAAAVTTAMKSISKPTRPLTITSTWQLKCSNSMHFHNSVIVLFIYRDGWPCDSFQGQSIQGQGQGLISLVTIEYRRKSCKVLYLCN